MEGEDRRYNENSFDYWFIYRYRLRWIYFNQIDSSLRERNQLWHAPVIPNKNCLMYSRELALLNPKQGGTALVEILKRGVKYVSISEQDCKLFYKCIFLYFIEQAISQAYFSKFCMSGMGKKLPKNI